MLDNGTHRQVINHCGTIHRLQREQRSLLARLRRNRRQQESTLEQIRHLVSPPPPDSSSASSYGADPDPQDDNLWADPNSPNAHFGDLLEDHDSQDGSRSS